MINKVVNWFRSTTFDGKIVKQTGTVFGTSKTGQTTIDVQSFEKGSSRYEKFVRLNIEYTGFGLSQMQVILDVAEARNLVKFINDAISHS